MSPTGPFIDSETGGLDTNQILTEAYPLVGLILLFASLALFPFIFTILLFGDSFIGFLFTLLTQLILAIGTGIILIYIIARAIQLADM
ncbi:hypothetical protein [Salinibaculum salinum]|uniref:hypothetical protein n=1 Tax=Salinibaculum salinum TaxID=3131996 RepID=UPI0030EF664B